MERIEDNKPYSIGVTIQGKDTWFMLHYNSTVYFENLNGDEVLSKFEEGVDNLRNRIKKYYGIND